MSIRVGAFVLVGFLVAVGGTLFALKKSSPTATPPVENKKVVGTQRMPWIEVVRPHVVEYDTRDGRERIARALKTGDEVGLGTMVETDAGGAANIYFPDGSALRLDLKTKVVLDLAKLNSENQELTARISLVGGRVWSKVLALLTPSSLWEVKTSNAVATVRGTSFGMTALQGKTSIIGGEQTVAVQAIDPETREKVGKEVLVTPDNIVEVTEKDIPLIKKGEKELRVERASAKILTDPWIRNAKEQDRKYDEKIKQLKENTSIQAPTPPQESKAPTVIGSQAASPVLQHPVLTIRTIEGLQNVTEGDRIQLKAIFTGPDGQTHDVTADVQWSVIGSIGKITGPGIFLAELGPNVSELGSAPGAITAVWKNLKTGEAMLAKSPIFRVEAKVEEPINTDG